MERFHFDVPYAEKDDARALGGHWDSSVKKWFAPTTDIRELMLVRWPEVVLSKKRKREVGLETEHTSNFFEISLQDSTFAEQHGAKWDFKKKCYYAPCETSWKDLVSFFDQVKDPKPADFVTLECKEREIPEGEKWESWMFDIPFQHKDTVKSKFDIRWDSVSRKWCAANMRTWDNLRVYFDPYVIDDEPSVDE
jgi:hypothetical protein